MDELLRRAGQPLTLSRSAATPSPTCWPWSARARWARCWPVAGPATGRLAAAGARHVGDRARDLRRLCRLRAAGATGSLPGAAWAAVYVNELGGAVDPARVRAAAHANRVAALAPLALVGGLVVAAAVAAMVLDSQPWTRRTRRWPARFLVTDGPMAAVATLSTVITLLGLLVAAGSLVLRYAAPAGSSASSSAG